LPRINHNWPTDRCPGFTEADDERLKVGVNWLFNGY
jgi:hypothetical protein